MVSTFDPGTQEITSLSVTAYFMSGLYQVQADADENEISHLSYYAIGGMTVALRDADGLKYLLTDHLGSVVAVTDDEGNLLSQQRYLPFGEIRNDTNTPPIPNSPLTQTDFAFTGQRNVLDSGLMDYKARMYDPLLGRFAQPDTIVPNPANPQAWDRYSYALNNPVRYIDPSGHSSCVGSHYDDGPDCAKREGSQLNIEIKNKSRQDRANVSGTDILDQLFSIAPFPSQSVHIPLFFYDWYFENRGSPMVDNGTIGVNPGSLRLGTYSLDTDGYASATILSWRGPVGSTTYESSYSIGIKLSLDTVGTKYTTKVVTTVTGPKGTNGFVQEITVRSERHPVRIVAGVAGVALLVAAPWTAPGEGLLGCRAFGAC